MWFKIYFYVAAIVTGISGFQRVSALTNIQSDKMWLLNQTLNMIDFAMSILTLVGLFGYLYKRVILTKQFWRVLTYIYITWILLFSTYSVFVLQPKSTPVPAFILVAVLTFVFTVLFIIPLVIGLFKYSKKEVIV